MLSAHHVLYGAHGRDDDERNLIAICGDGVSGCHGAFHAADPVARRNLGEAIAKRPDVMAYVQERLGEAAGLDYLRRRYLLDV